MATGPSPIPNVPLLGDDGIVRFSINNDNVNLGDFAITNGTGSLVLMLDGNDVVVASETDVPGGYANQIGGNKGDDALNGSGVRDYLLGGQGDDRVLGNGGDDLLNGNLGGDAVRGGDGNDVVRGGQGLDLVYGDAGNDFLTGDFGNDDYKGGEGNDIFGIRTETDATGNITEVDQIVDFVAGEDRIAIQGINSFFDLQFIEQTAPDFEEQPDGSFVKNDAIPGVAVTAVINGSQQFLFFARDVSVDELQSSSNFIVGTTANDLFNRLTPEAFLQDPTLGGVL
jgi:Ca2+-binding RTX toxin-like protein